MSLLVLDEEKSGPLWCLNPILHVVMLIGFTFFSFNFVFEFFGLDPWLPARYSNVLFPVLYAGLLGRVIWQARDCYRLLPTLEQRAKFDGMMRWMIVLVYPAVFRFSQAFLTDALSSVEVLAYFGSLFAIQALLGLIKMMLTPAAPKAPPGWWEEIDHSELPASHDFELTPESADESRP